MPEPAQHSEHRNLVETILRYIPGFRGYLEKQYRRDSDELQRQWLANRIERCKRSMDNLCGLLAEAGQIDRLPQIDRIRGRLDHLLARIRGAMEGYSGFFDFVQIREDMLEKIYRHDLGLIDEVDVLARAVEQLLDMQHALDQALTDLTAKIEAVQRRWDQREDILRGLD